MADGVGFPYMFFDASRSKVYKNNGSSGETNIDSIVANDNVTVYKATNTVSGSVVSSFSSTDNVSVVDITGSAPGGPSDVKIACGNIQELMKSDGTWIQAKDITTSTVLKWSDYFGVWTNFDVTHVGVRSATVKCRKLTVNHDNYIVNGYIAKD